jgi:hypothetical protein
VNLFAVSGFYQEESMFPFISFEWVWDIGHIVFMGSLWYAVSILGIGMTYCIIKAAIDTKKKEV